MKNTIVIFFSIFLFAISVLGIWKEANRDIRVLSLKDRTLYDTVIVLDAGHGGEDGGAVAEDKTQEKDLNLVIANDIALFFRLFGIPFVQTRSTDISVCDDGLLTLRERKRSDILNRYRLVNSFERSILLSVHQNMFSEKKYYGTQVFYSDNDDTSKILANEIRKSVIGALQPENKREIKPSGNSIYLLYKAKTTSVLVECGFLSNTEELGKLKTENYDASMAYYISRGLLNYLNLQEIKNGTKE